MKTKVSVIWMTRKRQIELVFSLKSFIVNADDNTNVEYIGVRVDSNSGVGGTPGSIHVFANAGLWPSKISLGTLFQTTSHCKYSQL